MLIFIMSPKGAHLQHQNMMSPEVVILGLHSLDGSTIHHHNVHLFLITTPIVLNSLLHTGTLTMPAVMLV